MQLRKCGQDALLVEVDSLSEVSALHAALQSAQLPNLVELVPAARTILISVQPGTGLTAVNRALDQADLTHPPEPRSKKIRIPVHYNGPDLDLIARTADLTTQEVIDLHSTTDYQVAFCGFAPGFAYLTGLPPALNQPRLATPRTKVPAGSVAIAGEFTAAYPRSTPGGWRLLGHTDAPLFDPRRDQPALLSPGDRVRFEPVG